MSENEKKKKIEKLARKFTSIEDPENKSIAFMIMTAYLEGREAGVKKEQERQRDKIGA